jgi:DNA-binding transcriptional ArsR family regulator
MIDDRYNDLIASLKISFGDLTEILKVLGNEKRLKIMILLLSRPQSYSTIVEEINLKKTAVSNHLTHLIKVGLIERGEYGIYKITGDGEEFLKAIEFAYQNSPSRQLQKFSKIERRKVSESFLNRFNI